MSFQLKKAEIKQRDAIIAQLEQCSSETADAIDEFNAQLAVLWMTLTPKISAHNKALAAAETFRQAVVTRLSDEFEEKSDKWHESEAGEAVERMLDAWREPVYGLEVERPEELVVDDIPAGKVLSELPTGPEEEDDDED